MGRTDNYSTSAEISPHTSAITIIHDTVMLLFNKLRTIHKFKIEDIRGLGLHGQKLESLKKEDSKKHTNGKKRIQTNTISQAFHRIPKNPEIQKKYTSPIMKPVPKKKIIKPDHSKFVPNSISQLDYTVLDELPSQLKNEVIETLKPRVIKPNPKKQPSKSKRIFKDDSDEVKYFKTFDTRSENHRKFIDIFNSNNLNQALNILLEMISSNLEDAEKCLIYVKSKKESFNDADKFIFFVQEKVKEQYGGYLNI